MLIINNTSAFINLTTTNIYTVSVINNCYVVDEVENDIQLYNYKRRHSGINYMALDHKLKSDKYDCIHHVIIRFVKGKYEY